MKVAIYTLGCKVNQYETQAMEQSLRARGHEVVDFADAADAYVVNTCSVTAVGDQKSRQAVRRVRREHPGAVVAVCGCYPQTHGREAGELGADLIGGTGDRLGFCRCWRRPRRSVPARRWWHWTNPCAAGSLRFCPPADWKAAPGPC